MADGNGITEQRWSRSNKCTDTKTLQEVIESMDSLSQEGFEQIAAISRLAITAIKSQGPAGATQDIEAALRMIWGKADDILNLINCEAENVGCNYRSREFLEKVGKVAKITSH